MNDMIQLMKNHRTYRHFDTDYQLPDADLQQILDAARQAPTWMNGQMYTILVIKDPAIREALVALNPTNPHMRDSSVFLLFLADLKRTQKVAEKMNADYPVAEGLNHLLTATTDAALALQNAVNAVEALGLGSVVVGSVRNRIAEVGELLNLPDYVYPVAGLSIGKPNVEMAIKPRLPEAAVVHYDTYQDYDYDLIEDYVATMEEFAEARETKTWTQKFADYFGHAPSSVVDDYLRSQKLIK